MPSTHFLFCNVFDLCFNLYLYRLQIKFWQTELSYLPVTDPGFPEGGAPTAEGVRQPVLFRKTFAEKHENETIWRGRP